MQSTHSKIIKILLNPLYIRLIKQEQTLQQTKKTTIVV